MAGHPWGLMKRLGISCVGLSLAAIVLGVAAGAAQTPHVNPDAQILADFTARVKTYTDLRDKVDNGAPTLKPTTDPAKILEAERALAARIRAARATAKPGDIFAPAIEKKFRALLRPEVKGRLGSETRSVILDEKPAVWLKVNAEYPPDQPLSTVPAQVLETLPTLPDGLEYRFVNHHLILRDTRANVIVDYLLNAIA